MALFHSCRTCSLRISHECSQLPLIRLGERPSRREVVKPAAGGRIAPV